MTLPERSYTSGSGYRFGFNGKETDKEYGAGGGTQDYGFRMYNPAIGKFLSVYPLFRSYPWYTPYQFAGNMPIAADDIDGLESRVRIYVNTFGKPFLISPAWNVRQGDTYWSVSQATGVPVSEIKRLNQYEEKAIAIGVELRLSDDYALPMDLDALSQARGKKVNSVYSTSIAERPNCGTITVYSASTNQEAIYHSFAPHIEKVIGLLAWTDVDDYSTIMSGVHVDSSEATKTEVAIAGVGQGAHLISGAALVTIYKAIKNIDLNKWNHILKGSRRRNQSKGYKEHGWGKLFANPNQLKVSQAMAETLAHGTEFAFDEANGIFKKVYTTKKEPTVEVTYKKADDSSIQISDSWFRDTQKH